MERLFRKKAAVLLAGSLIAFFLLTWYSCSKNEPEAAGPLHLKTEYQTNPLGIDTATPRFSWQVNDNRRQARQSAYQLLVASDPDILENDEGDIWDSGKITSDQSVHVRYAGPPLQSAQRCYWKVRTWDEEGNSSVYSAPAFWEMGLLSPKDWNGTWIGKEIENVPQGENWPWGDWIWHPSEVGIHAPVFFRKEFDIPAGKKISEALARTTADNYFTLTINGKLIGKGSKWTEVYDFNVKSDIKNGKNLIAVKAANSLGEVCGFIFSLKISFDDGSELVINSDASWKTTNRIIKEWSLTAYNDKNWGHAHVVGTYAHSEWGKIDPEDTYYPPRSVMVRNEFNLDKELKKARAYVTGLGSYVLFVNGTRIGSDIFTPGWTDYPTRIQYQTYDVTPLLKKGANAVGAILGNMWWSGGLGWKGAVTYSNGPLRFLLQLNIEYQDGSKTEIVSSPQWKACLSPLIANQIYDGETYDAREEKPGWNAPVFNDSGWTPVIKVDQAKVKLVAQQGPTIQITKTLEPVKITEIDSGKFIIDLGQNMVGWVKLKVRGERGTKVTMRFAELLKNDGTLYTENLRTAKATDTYILKGQGLETWQPMFTYHGFRYVELSGYPGTPGKDVLTGQVLHSAPPMTLEFACSNELINKIQHNIIWGQRGNMMSVPTDCPQRDERLGWMGDAQIFAPTACYNMRMVRFFSKWMHDITDCQDKDGAVHDVSPTIVVTGPAKPGWGDAVVIIPWVVYQYYGDQRIIEENYKAMSSWVAYMQNHSENYLYERSGYGDWIAVVESPKEPIGAAYFFYSTKLLAQMAGIIGKTSDQKKFEQLADHIAGAFQKRYYNPDSARYQGNTQTANLLPLAFGITPKNQIPLVLGTIIEDIHKNGNHLTTGFLGTAYLLPVLSQYGQHELAYQMASQKDYPSWGYMVEKGATTIWELWNSDTQGPGMNSRNHFALGSVGEWFYTWLAGLRPGPDGAGFKKTIIAPKPAGNLTWAEARMQSLYGEIYCFWKKSGNKFALEINIPANTSAMVHIPNLGQPWPLIEESGKPLLKTGQDVILPDDIKLIDITEEEVIFEVGSGKYSFTATL